VSGQLISVPPFSLHSRRAAAHRPEVAAQHPIAKRRAGFVAVALLVVAIMTWALWSIASPILGLTLIVFSTDTMAPQMPVGSLAIVQTVPASSVGVGDVVSVQRSGVDVPVTQRVVAVAATSLANHAVLTLLPDAEASNVGVNYHVATAGRVVGAVPGLGGALVNLAKPIVLTPIVALLIVMSMWVLWPDDRESRTGRRTAAQH
jgi:signal peptidase I